MIRKQRDSRRVILFLRDQALWRSHLKGTGNSLQMGTCERLLSVSYRSGRWLKLLVSANAHWIAVDDGTGYDLDKPGGLWLIGTSPKVTVHKVSGTASPSFAPDSRRIAMTRIAKGGKYSVVVLDFGTNQWRTVRNDASQPFWSDDGREIAVITASAEKEEGLVVGARDSRILYRTGASASLAEPILSPNGRFVAVLCAISRPKQGHILYDRQTGKTVERSLDWPNRLPGVLYGWSSDGKWLACNWRVPNPKNEGTWLHDEVGLLSASPGVCRWIDRGSKATFGPDSQHLFWLRSNGTLCAASVGQKSSPIEALLQDVDAFALAG